MADLSKFKLGNTTYSLKDNEARTAIASLESTIASSLVFKGVITSVTDLTNLTNYEAGWTYKVGASLDITGLGTVESGDMIVCVTSGSSYVATNWNVVQNNIDTMTAATASSAGTRGLVPAPAAGEETYFLRGDGTWASVNNDITWGSFSDLIS